MTSGNETIETDERARSQIEEAYWRLRQEIITGRLRAGDKLRIEFVHRTYGFGASGIREALSRLLSDGLVKCEAQRGFWVAPVSREDLRDITAARKVIEVETLRQSIKHGNLDWEMRVVATRYALEKIEVSLTEDAPEEVMTWERANREFHMALLSGCPIRRLLRFTEKLYDESQRYRGRTRLRRTIPRSGLSEDHLMLVEATLKRQSGLAGEILAEHIQSIADTAENAIFGSNETIKSGK